MYALYKRSPNGQKVWLYVCEHHEQMIGDENMSWTEQKRDTYILVGRPESPKAESKDDSQEKEGLR